MSSPDHMRRRFLPAPRNLRGALLIELMVGLAVGGLVSLVALAVLQMLGQTQRIVDDQSQLLQQAGYVFRVLGQQIRAAGSRELESLAIADPATGVKTFRYAASEPAAEITDAAAEAAIVVRGASGASDTVHDSLTLAEAAFTGPDGIRRDCLGQEAKAGQPLVATFQVDARGVLRCKSGSGQNQPMAYGVAGFQIRYRVRQGDLMRDLDASAVDTSAQWPQVIAVEVCLDLRGDPVLAGTEQRYVDCKGKDAVDISRRHLIVQRLFRLRADRAT